MLSTRALRLAPLALLLGSALAGEPITPEKQAAADFASMASTVRAIWPAGVIPAQTHPGSWTYEIGVLLDGLAANPQLTAKSEDFAYIRSTIDRWVDRDGRIFVDPQTPLKPEQHTLDNVEPGRAILLCYRLTGDERYAKAARYLAEQLTQQPRNAAGGYWHKQAYPEQMWLDGAFMAEPFRAAYAQTFHQNADFDDIAKQLLLMDEHMRDAKTGLLHHGWDASHKEKWADPATGLSPEVWARAMGWYAMALVDTLPSFPQDHPQRAKLIATLQHVADGIAKYQDPRTGLWWDVLDKGSEPGNFLETSASAMFTYALAKGVRLGYLAPTLGPVAQRGWAGLEQRLTHDPDGHVTLHGTVKVSGLGGSPYRSGDYSYYIHEAVGDNDPKGVGAYLLAASEIERGTHHTLKMAR